MQKWRERPVQVEGAHDIQAKQRVVREENGQPHHFGDGPRLVCNRRGRLVSLCVACRGVMRSSRRMKESCGAENQKVRKLDPARQVHFGDNRF
jgi:hypothetical protein